MKQDLRYTHGDIFETFPFPDGVLTDDSEDLADLGRAFFEARRGYMVANDKGMTKFYNDFHDPDCDDEAILACRELQVEINEAVLAAYDFTDIDLDIGFHEVGYLPPDKSTRFTMSEAARGQILAKLALLNKERHEAESRKVEKGSSKQAAVPSDAVASDDLFSAQGARR